MTIKKEQKSEYRKMKIVDLKIADYNPRKISPEALKGLSASLEKFGNVQPIVWNKRTGRVVGGHQRLKVLQEQGITEVDVVEVDLSEREEKALNLSLNNPHIQGEFTIETEQIINDLFKDCPELVGDLKLEELYMKPSGDVILEDMNYKDKKNRITILFMVDQKEILLNELNELVKKYGITYYE